jgi:hypothetical protein
MAVYRKPRKADAETKVLELWRTWLTEQGISRPTPNDRMMFFITIPRHVLAPLGRGDPWQYVDSILQRGR